MQRARARMVDHQLRSRDITDPRVLEAMGRVPRHLFVPPDAAHLAYSDMPLPIGQRQTISQPYIVALMSQSLGLRGHERVLEVGTGSGYQAAVLAALAAQVYSLERLPDLAERAREILLRLGLTNVEVIVADGSSGLPEHSPYDGIIVTAAAPRPPQPLLDQLAERGRLVVPVGGIEGQMLERWTHEGDGFNCERVAPVAFVPLVGQFGWHVDLRPRPEE
ncbi:MAG TPA: protein-L-isoaspartate(D-aspartate) O-methyltransferase [Anaerolineales bacterium]|nr:protein-L-isoaspartate(D-aspartate) O-methyltransferase [Anaerolineales bacterium]